MSLRYWKTFFTAVSWALVRFALNFDAPPTVWAISGHTAITAYKRLLTFNWLITGSTPAFWLAVAFLGFMLVWKRAIQTFSHLANHISPEVQVCIVFDVTKYSHCHSPERRLPPSSSGILPCLSVYTWKISFVLPLSVHHLTHTLWSGHQHTHNYCQHPLLRT